MEKLLALSNANLYAGELVPIPTFWLVSTVTATVPLLVASCSAPVVSAVATSAVLDVVPAEIVLAMFCP
jgi:hypothetical protein